MNPDASLPASRTRLDRLSTLVSPLWGGRVVDGEDLAARKNLLLLVQLRWIAVAGQVLSIAAAALALGLTLPLLPMAAVVGGLVALNLVSLVRLGRASPVANAELLASLLLDVAALTTQLYLSGGAANPFVFLFLLQITLGAVLLEGRSIIVLFATVLACFAGLMLFFRPLALIEQPGLSDLYLVGLLICFALNAGLLVVFVTRINQNLRERDTRLAGLRQRAAEEDHIVRMGLLASGAAHELGTPLATLSIILGDWKRMPRLAEDPELAAEIAAMESEVRRCKSIVTGILLSAGEARGESAGATTLVDFLEELAEDWLATRPNATLEFRNLIDEDRPIVSESTLRQVVFNVLDNAFEASPGWIGFTAEKAGDLLVLSIEDRGPGFAPDVLERIGRPYQSTKGKLGGGLGLFLVVNVLRKLGGTVETRNKAGGGAVVTLGLPLGALAIDRS